MIEKCIKQENPSGDALLRMERAGDEAFDVIRDALIERPLGAHQKINALRRLALLTRQQCQERKEEVLDLALRSMRDESILVRSAATNAAIALVRLLEKLPAARFRTKYPVGAKPSSVS
ncbi:MAG: hypothetical protein WKG00_35030 [Polyangiaceae bacterium]